ncbi:class I SAM-dependent DNA methyltransferase [Tautonia rosea]|uniref:class I SAM-dependent DNA methyltransferase n=1 Tax=Tautonia rosea TaxID=2728037 RepID=UPI0014755BAF|nr:class I SAM-dependent DNA methyltransferase [Tautonia rosea]
MRGDEAMEGATLAPTDFEDFVTRWEASGAAERANYQLFLSELCDVLGVPRPEPTRPDDSENAYVFERAVTFQNGDGSTSTGRIDLYKRDCFILEAKQGSEKPTEADPAALALAMPKKARKKGTAVRGTAKWDEAMLAAKGQAEQYVRALPASEPNPPFLVVVDVGHSIELFADFTRQGRTYVPFPDAQSHRLRLRDLARPDALDRLRLVWSDPQALDPTRRAAKVTREVAGELASLAKSLEASGHAPEAVAHFLMRCLFTFFAEDVGLLPEGCFTDTLRDLKAKGEARLFPEMVRSLWETMKTGGFSPVIRSNVYRFNGGLYENADALPLTDDQLDLLIRAGSCNWREVEPAIFGTLLERALNPIERHKLGAHYTPRAYVERLVMPTIIEPLREQWDAVKAAAVTLTNEDAPDEARAEVRAFLDTLCQTTVLDPACGTGNFLYVTLEHMKRLEGEVRDVLHALGDEQAVFEGYGMTVDPHQFKGIEINPRAAAIADLVLWIGYLQWHLRTLSGKTVAEPIIRDYQNIECRDAVLAYDRVEPVTDDQGNPVTRWDGRTTRPHPVTGEPVPDESARVPVLRYVNPRKAEWPEANYVVGNPPFVGNKRMRLVLGDGYVEALRQCWADVAETVDFVMYWWEKASKLTQDGKASRFGFITTNSIVQSFNRKPVQAALDNGLSLIFAVADHPWVDSHDGADVRIAMTVCAAGTLPGTILETVPTHDEDNAKVFRVQIGTITSALTVGVDLSCVISLRSNAGLSCPGVQLSGQGFVLGPEIADTFSEVTVRNLIRPYLTGRDLTQTPRRQYVLDTINLAEDELRKEYPDAYQWLFDRVRPERLHNPRPKYAREWWLHSEPRARFRKSLESLKRFVVTSRTARHRTFQFLDSICLPETKVLVFAFGDALFLGILSSRIHTVFANATGGWLGVGNDSTYNHSSCFDPFPFPVCEDHSSKRIRELSEELDAHRKRQQAAHPDLTLTGMYNVLAKLRSGEPLTEKDRAIHERGLVSVLRQIHDDLDAAVFDAYGWPHDLADEDILRRLVDLNRERAAEEADGLVRWLRPDFQAPDAAKPKPATQARLGLTPDDEPEPAKPAPGRAPKAAKLPWPKTLPEQVKAVRSALSSHPSGISPDPLARTFLRARADRVQELLDALVSLGQARELEGGRYVAS